MKIQTTNSSILRSEEYRLTAKPYCSEIFECREIIKRCQVPKQSLKSLSDAIFNGPRFKRNWVIVEEFGCHLISGSEMLQSRLEHVSMISRKSVMTMKEMILKEDTILISSYGTVGRLIYVRPDMYGMVGSDNVMKVIINNQYSSGYVFAYLKSKFGVPLIVHGTNGGVVPFLEPKRVFSLDVPFFADIEQKVDEKVKKTARLAAESANLMKESGIFINQHFAFPSKLALSHRVYTHSAAASSLLQKRMDATYHDRIAQLSDDLIEQAGAEKTLVELGVVALERNRMKQIFAEQEYGVPFYTSGEIFRADVTPERYLLKKIVKDDPDWQTKEEDILIARSGQVGGIIGTGVWADKRFKNTCVSPHVLRLSVTGDTIDAGYLYAFLCCTDVGYRQLIRGAAGSSVPFLSIKDILNIKVPRLGNTEEKRIGDMVRKAGDLAAEAQFLEKKAVAFVEEAIEAAAPKH